uniref:Putative cell division control protein n=1 Tax=Trypanosoma congolense (strain IL3000) TaxID=1068625 RepID=G0UMS8_TRYCI|nr:putative cell division control protein [Trypanosoma congolense IL3000]
MTRLRFKGGAWTNTEDEVLRASLTVYGLQNWERVASTLGRKTAAQCRERWENFLDPRLNIQEAWTPEEEEQLVQLQSLFPNQWNLIAREIMHRCNMNRPAWLCEEYYHSLLDALEYKRSREAGDAKSSSKLTLEEFLEERKRQRGVHRGIETRDARPDAVDMETSDKEMVEFTVSRLANQDGKKGLRKERKKQLEHTSFLAKLQSNREAIESGTLSARAKKRMERAMLEDRSGSSNTNLLDTIVEDHQDDSEGVEGRTDKQRAKFQPIDLDTDKRAAGIQAKQRVLVKEFSATAEPDEGRPSSKGSAPNGVNLEMLRIGNAAAKTSKPLLESKKGVALLKDIVDASGDVSAKRCPVEPPRDVAGDVVDLDSLFASLPGVVGAPRRPAAEEEAFDVDGPFTGLPGPISVDRKAERVSAAIFVPRNEELEESALSHSVEPVLDVQLPLDFSSSLGQALLAKSKRLVTDMSRQMLTGCMGLHRDPSAHSGNDCGERVIAEEGVGSYGQNVDFLPDSDEINLVRILVANQMDTTPERLLGFGSVQEKIPVKVNKQLAFTNEGHGSVGDLWRDVSAAEAMRQVGDQLQQRRDRVTSLLEGRSNSSEERNARRCPEHIIRVCFSPSHGPADASSMSACSESGAGRGSVDDASQRLAAACAYWSGELQEAQRKLAFYTAVSEAERREISQRLNSVGSKLEAAEQEERNLQEAYRTAQIAVERANTG